MNLLHRTYRKFRAEGLRASHAMHAARTELAWDEAEAAGLVRLRWVPDEECYDDSYIDMWTDVRECDRKRMRKDLWAQIERDGVWGIVAEYVSPVCPCCKHGGVWEQGGSVWGFVGERDCGYESDVKSECLDALAKARAESAHAA
jgi:hypothetical protein